MEGNEKVLTFQRYVETCKFANGLKKFMKDPNFASQTVGSVGGTRLFYTLNFCVAL